MVFFLYTVIIFCSRCAQTVTETEFPELLHIPKSILGQSRTEPAIQALTPASLVSVVRTFAFVCFYPLPLWLSFIPCCLNTLLSLVVFICFYLLLFVHLYLLYLNVSLLSFVFSQTLYALFSVTWSIFIIRVIPPARFSFVWLYYSKKCRFLQAESFDTIRHPHDSYVYKNAGNKEYVLAHSYASLSG